MKPKYKPPIQDNEKNPGKPTKKLKDKKVWVKEYQWKSEKDFNTFPKWFADKKTYDQDWHPDSWGKHKSAKGIEDSLKSQVRSWGKRWVEGRNWRARNTETGEIIEFPDIEKYYD